MTAAAAKPALEVPAKKVKQPKTVKGLYVQYLAQKENAKYFYDLADGTLKKLIRVHKRDKKALVDEKHYLEITDKFRGQLKVFAPAFAHRYDLKERTLETANAAD